MTFAVTYLNMTFATTANITSVVETGDYFVRTVICTIIWASFTMSHVDDMRGDRMDDLISRQAAIDALDVLCQEHRYKIPGKRETYSQYNEAWQDALDRAEGAIFNLPSAQPERKTGRWIIIRPTKEDRPYVACDQCGQVEAWDENCGMLCALLGEKYAHYCPNCGAYMGGDT